MVVENISFQVHKSLQRIRERKLANFIPWGPASIQGHTTFRLYLVHYYFNLETSSHLKVRNQSQKVHEYRVSKRNAARKREGN